jgi:hypothetical protein
MWQKSAIIQDIRFVDINILMIKIQESKPGIKSRRMKKVSKDMKEKRVLYIEFLLF